MLVILGIKTNFIVNKGFLSSSFDSYFKKKLLEGLRKSTRVWSYVYNNNSTDLFEHLVYICLQWININKEKRIK
jgi:hypothetical protein